MKSYRLRVSEIWLVKKENEMALQLVEINKSSATIEGLLNVLCQKIPAMFHKVWEIKRFQAAKVTFKVIGNGAT